MMKSFEFTELRGADLVVDALYKGGRTHSGADDPLNELLQVGIQGGFRFRGSIREGRVTTCVLYTDLADPDWPDSLDVDTGRFTYYGDNKRPGGELHQTKKLGNVFLQFVFEQLHTHKRTRIPPILVFTKGALGRDVVFRGLAVPGAPGLPQTEDLVAVWKTRDGKRFQNYRATFTILDVSVVRRDWIASFEGRTVWSHPSAPRPWSRWIEGGKYLPLRAPRALRYRTPEEQLPTDDARMRLLRSIVKYFSSHPQRQYAFERCAADLVQKMDANVGAIDLTRPWRDGGRDGLGSYRIGTDTTSIQVEFALEAKCKKPSPTSSSGVRDTARLIARLRHRQFGIFVTTSCLNRQAYQEIVEDGHPVLVVSGSDIIDVLYRCNVSSHETLLSWLQEVAPT